jgi:pimeloyl-ACP methyl ester carboxylesterase
LVDVLPGIKDQRARHRLTAPPASPASVGPGTSTRYAALWEALASVTVPVLLARGMRPDSVLDDEDERELLRRLPGAEVVHVEGPGTACRATSPWS